MQYISLTRREEGDTNAPPILLRNIRTHVCVRIHPRAAYHHSKIFRSHSFNFFTRIIRMTIKNAGT